MGKFEHLSWDQIQSVAQDRNSAVVKVHLHSPDTEATGKPVFNVLDSRGKTIGTTSSAHLRDPFVQVSLGKLEQHLNKTPNPLTGKRGKTQNTVIVGTPTVDPISGSRQEPVRARPGSVTVGDAPVMRVQSKQVGDRVVVDRSQPARSGVFAKGVSFTDTGMQAVFDED